MFQNHDFNTSTFFNALLLISHVKERSVQPASKERRPEASTEWRAEDTGGRRRGRGGAGRDHRRRGGTLGGLGCRSISDSGRCSERWWRGEEEPQRSWDAGTSEDLLTGERTILMKPGFNGFMIYNKFWCKIEAFWKHLFCFVVGEFWSEFTDFTKLWLLFCDSCKNRNFLI